MPNVLLLWTDQQRFDTLACYGNDSIRMPHLNALAAGATVFERAYCSSPVCTPSRGSVMTGMYGHVHQAMLNNQPLSPEVPTWAEMLPPDQYASAYIGKWHLGDEIYAQRGFAHWAAIEDDYQRFFSAGRNQDDRSAYHHWLVSRGYQAPANNHFPRDWCCMLPERDSKPAFCAEEAVQFIESQAGGSWVCSVNTLEPHHPLPSARNGDYLPEELPVAENFLQTPESVPLRVRMSRARVKARGFEQFHMRDASSWRQAMSHYWGLCSLVDNQYGRILTALKESGQYDDTLIIFTSDHGDMMGCHGLFGKSVPYEASCHIPLLMKLPGQTEGRRVAQPVSLVDLAPSIVDCLGHAVPAGLHGRSLRRLAEGGEEAPRDILMQWFGREPTPMQADEVPEEYRGLGSAAELAQAQDGSYRSLFSPDGWKVTVTDQAEWECYHVEEDPGELHNVVGSMDQSLLADLRDRLVAEQARVGDTLMPIPDLP